MTYDLIRIDRQSAVPMYQQLYQCIRQAIENGHLPVGTKLPSIRKLSEDLLLSRTTIEGAYQQLCVEGFIASRPQSGYYVHIDVVLGAKKDSGSADSKQADEPFRRVRYNLGSDSIDSESADIKRWRVHLRDVLNRRSAIISYGESQGETSLRKALAVYSYALRGVSCRADNILIGAGTQALLYLLCGLLRPFGTRIAMEKGGFQKAKQVFLDSGFEVAETNGTDIQALYEQGIQLCFVTPSGNLTTGQPMKMNQRYEMLYWAEQTGGLIIEDDYNGELRYTSHPLPSLQGMDSDRVIYIGSFSKLLLPSVRIGYMVLPELLMDGYRKKSHMYNQTASKIEQLALASYLHSGQLDRQLRRLRKIYAEKSSVLLESLQKAFGSTARTVLHENSLCVTLTLPDNGRDMAEEAGKQGVKVTRIPNSNAGESSLRLGFAGISVEDIEPAVEILRKIYVHETAEA